MLVSFSALAGLLIFWFFGALLGYWVWFDFASGAIIFLFVLVSALYGVALFFGGREEKNKKARIRGLIDQIKADSHSISSPESVTPEK
jgi:hypothetical protein